MTTTKQDLVSSVAKDTSLKQSEIKKVIESFLSNITIALNDGNDVALRGFGTFKVITRKAKTARNISTNEPISLPEKQIIKFKNSIDVL